MSMEEAAQEVRRILRQNDVEETLHYLSTVTRSIEENQHDLRAAIGNSYRDLLAACDSIVGMEKDCQDILTIEAALDQQNEVHPSGSAAAAATAPLLPPEWFARLQHRRRHTIPAAATTTVVNAPDADRIKIASAGDQGTAAAAVSKTPSKPSKHERGARTAPVASLPKVVLPLPPAPAPAFTFPNSKEASGSDREGKLLMSSTTARFWLEERVRLDDELQSLHLQYMAVDAAIKSKDKGGTEVDMRRVFSWLCSDNEHCCADTSGKESAATPQRLNGEGTATTTADIGALPVSALQTPSRVSRFPLLSFAQRLQRVQERLTVLKKEALSADHTTIVLHDAPASTRRVVKPSLKVPAWVVSFQRRATTLETRLIKLLVVRLRRTADAYAQLFDTRVYLEQLSKGFASPPTTNKRRESSTDMNTADRESEEEELLSRRRALQAEEKRYAVYLCAVLAECHGVFRALCTSPTLLGALVACTPGVDLPRTAQPDILTPTAGEGEGNSETEGRCATPVEGLADALFYIAALKAREVVTKILYDGMDRGSGSASSRPAVHGHDHQQQQQKPEGLTEDIGCVGPSRWLVALISVLLLREAQVSAARWSTVVSPIAIAVSKTPAPPHPQSKSANGEGQNNTNTNVKNNGATTALESMNPSSSSIRRYRSSNATFTSAAARARVFANADVLASLGLSSFIGFSHFSFAETRSAAAVAMLSAPPRHTPATAGRTANTTISNTAWALRCCSGLCFLVRGVADYIDLVKLSIERRKDDGDASSTPFPYEMDVLDLLRAISQGNAQLRGGNDNNENDNIIHYHSSDGDDNGGEWGQTAGMSGEVTEMSFLGGGARSLEELLSWRRKGRSGGIGTNSMGSPIEGPNFSSNSPLASPYSNSTTSSNSPSPLNKEKDRSLNTMTVADSNETTPGRQLMRFHGKSESKTTLPTAVRCRACVETLRASLTTVAELNSAGATQTTPQPLLAEASTTDTQQKTDMSNNAAKRSDSPEVESLSSTSLVYVACALLAPLVSSLVVNLARDPVAIAEFSDYTTQQEGTTEGEIRTRGGSATQSVSSSMSTVLSPLLRAGGSFEKYLPKTGTTPVGASWSVINDQLRWEQTRHIALQVALQRCFTVALQSMNFVEDCVVRGLIQSTRDLTASTEAKDTAFTAVSEDVTARDAVWTFEKLQQTWRMLSDVLQRHTLTPTPYHHHHDTDADLNGMAPPYAEEVASTNGHTPQSLGQSGKARAVAANYESFNSDNSRNNHYNSLSAIKASCGRGHLAPTAAGIDWGRFRTAGMTITAAAGGSLDRSCRVTQAGTLSDKSNSTAHSAGNGLFREEELEWGKTTLQSAQLLPILTEFSTPEDEPNAVRLSLEQQASMVTVLSEFRRRLFPHWPTAPSLLEEDVWPGNSKSESEHQGGGRRHRREDVMSMTDGMPFNGHAVELLNCCLQTLVRAVNAFGATPVSHVDGVFSLREQYVSMNSGGDGAAASGAPLYTRVLLWLKKALEKMKVELHYLPHEDKEHDASPPTPSEVVHSYEVALVLRVYDNVLRQLSMIRRSPHDNTVENEVAPLCKTAAALLHRSSSLWQKALLAYYTDALRHLYYVQLRLESREPSSAQGGGRRTLRSTRLLIGLADSSSWMRASSTTTSASNDSDKYRSSSSSRAVAYPAVPTPALTHILQRTLRLLHEALYGKTTVYGGNDRTPLRGGSRKGGGASSDPEGGSGATDNRTNVVDAALPTRWAGITHQLVSPEECQQVLRQMTHATAELFTHELLPLLPSPSSFCSSTDDTSTHRTMSGASSDADNARVQWLMDVLLLSAVWGSGSSYTNNAHDGVAVLFGSPSSDSFNSNSGSRSADVTFFVAPGPLRRVVLLLEKSCDPIRWRSAVPLVMAAYRNFLSSSAALWVTCGLDDANAEKGRVNMRSGMDGAKTGEKEDDKFISGSAALAAAMKPFGATYPGGGSDAAPPVANLLQPREHVDRLALLPVAVSNTAAMAAAGGNIGVGPSGPSAFVVMAATAASLNPYAAPSSTSSVVGGVAALGGPAYRTSGLSSVASHSGVVSESMFAEGASVLDGETTAAAAGGSAARLGAAAASSLWGTTQRGWNQLWRSS